MDTILFAAWLVWLGVIFVFIGIDLLREPDRSLVISLAGVGRKTGWQQAAEGIGPIISVWMPVINMEKLRKKLIWAGELWGISAEGFIGFKVMGLAGGFAVSALFSTIGLPSVFVPIFAVLAYLGPDYFLTSAVEGRKRDIYRDMPDMVALLATAVSAGVELAPALETVGQNMTGPLGEELRRTWREIATGRPRSAAMRDMAGRTGVPVVERFVEVIVTAEERGGMDVSKSLSTFMQNLRDTQKRKAQEQARKIPTKMNLPLILCIFLPMLAMLLYPVLIMVTEAL